MKLKIEFELDNAAYQDDDGCLDRDVVRETVMATAHRIFQHDGDSDGVVIDPNGNRVGTWTIEP